MDEPSGEEGGDGTVGWIILFIFLLLIITVVIYKVYGNSCITLSRDKGYREYLAGKHGQVNDSNSTGALMEAGPDFNANRPPADSITSLDRA